MKTHNHAFRFPADIHAALKQAPAMLTLREGESVSKTEFVERAIREYVERHKLTPPNVEKKK